jgi:hypothetical protein
MSWTKHVPALEIALSVQIVGLFHPLKTKPFCMEALCHAGEVLLVDGSDSYKTKLLAHGSKS